MRFNERTQGLLGSEPVFAAENWQSLKSLLFIGTCHFALSSALGCGPSFSSNNQINEAAPHQGEVSNRKLVIPSIDIAGGEPHSYHAVIRWPEGTPNLSIILNKKQIFQAQDKSQVSYTLDLKDGQDYFISLVSQETQTDEPQFLKEWKVKTPTDVVLVNSEIDEAFKNQAKLTIQAHRVFVLRTTNDEASFLTRGRELLINTDELIADEALVQSFPKKQKAEFDQDGRNGGSITIKAVHAIGNLSFQLRGEHGGDGKNGAPFSSRAQSGANGKAADYTFHCSGDHEQICTCDYRTAYREIGGRGANGEPGRNGSNGGRGGNSGSLKVEISDRSPKFHINVVSEGGVSGNPGRAGPPQQGGVGGKAWVPPSSPWTTFVCNGRRDGDYGDPGALGQDGTKQSDGIIEINCISIGEGFGRCS